VSHHENLTTSGFSGKFFSSPKKLIVEIGNRDEKTITGEGVKGERVRTTSNSTGGKSMREKSKSTGENGYGTNTVLIPWGISTVSIDFDVSSVEGESQLQMYMQVQQTRGPTTQTL
jgi:hypothetical protein